MQKKVHACPSLSFLPGAPADEAARQGASHSDTTPGRALAEVLERGGIAYEKSIQFAFRHEETPLFPPDLEAMRAPQRNHGQNQVELFPLDAFGSAVPHWDETKCIQCNQCAYVCPHATANTTTKYIAVKMPTLMRSFPVSLPPVFRRGSGCVPAIFMCESLPVLLFGRRVFYEVSHMQQQSNLANTHRAATPNGRACSKRPHVL